ncbi:MAG TPA: dTDP-4-dehydrorhamnose 3,5-epimerase [Noviherbaspirillum sp.]
MKLTTTFLPDLLILEPEDRRDDRGFFYESFNQRRFETFIGTPVNFVQDNHSKSARNVLRGLHYQIRKAQGKLVRVIAGEIFDVAVDIRRSSPTFGRWFGTPLSAENRRQMWIPPGFAHGFIVTGESAEVIYKTTEYWAPEYERSILWNDKSLDIDWPFDGKPLLSPKDQAGKPLAEAEVYQ